MNSINGQVYLYFWLAVEVVIPCLIVSIFHLRFCHSIQNIWRYSLNIRDMLLNTVFCRDSRKSWLSEMFFFTHGQEMASCFTYVGPVKVIMYLQGCIWAIPPSWTLHADSILNFKLALSKDENTFYSFSLMYMFVHINVLIGLFPFSNWVICFREIIRKKTVMDVT